VPADDAEQSPPGLDLEAVTAWLAAARPEVVHGPLTARLIAGGRSNLTYLVRDGERRFVLRRPPLGHVLATAHDMAREYRMISALAGTRVPVPQALALCADPEVTGAPFYVMSHVDGRVVRGPADLADLDVEARHELSLTMIDVLAELHTVDPASVALDGFGRPEGFMARQVRRWSAQLEQSRSRDLPGIEALRDALATGVPDPSPRPGIVHGDYRLDNLVVAGPTDPDALAVRAVLDWEMATVGEPLADVGLLLAYWDGLGGRENSVAEAIGPANGFPSGARLAARYAERTGANLDALPWYVAFGFFKIAVILEGIHYRFTLGQTVGDGFDRIGHLVPELGDLGERALAS
jgi:aminoglycoside phosphotransferase (APT) family kinase protein